MNKQEEDILNMMGNTKGELGNLKKMTDELQGFSRSILPSEKFIADIDGIQVEISKAMSGKMLIILFPDPVDLDKKFEELKQNKKGFFNRIFKK